MRPPRLLVLAMAAAMLLPRAWSCSCAPPPPPCQAYWQAKTVFLGTVTEILAHRGQWVSRARMRIDKAYKGIQQESVILFDDGMCDGPMLKVGQQYLMYIHMSGDGDLPSRGCTRSRPAEYAAEDLAYLNGLGDATPLSSIFGQVKADADDGSGERRPLAGARVELTGDGRTHAAAADGEGRYWFEKLQPATYTLRGLAEGFRMLSFSSEPVTAAVEPRGCAEVNLVMQRMWQGRISGRVLRPDGTPPPAGQDLALLRVRNRDGQERTGLLFGSGGGTNERGEYSFDEVAPGRYKLVMNLYRFPTANSPYPTLYWPASPDEGGAQIIEVSELAGTVAYDFHLPAAPKGVEVQGVALGPDGRTARGVQVSVTALPNNSIARHDENRPVTDQDGRFSFTAFEGFEYELRASLSGARNFHAAKTRFSLKQGHTLVTLVCDRPGRFDGDPLESRPQP